MKEQKWTPEPWIFNGDQVMSLDCSEVADCFQNPGPNAERITQCVNACRNLPDPGAALEAARKALVTAESEMRDLYSDHPSRIEVRTALALLGGNDGR